MKHILPLSTFKTIILLALGAIAIGLHPTVVSAQSYGAYNLYAQGSLRAVGLGGASTALSDSASGVLSNPAGIVMGDFGVNVDSSNNPVDDDEQATGISNDTNFLFVALAFHMGKNWALAAGYSSPFTFASEEFFFDVNTSESVTRKIDLNVISYDLALSRKFGKFSIGVTGHYLTATEKIEETSDPDFDGIQTVRANVETEETAIYPTFGISYREKKFGLGASYSLGYTIEMDTSLNSQISGSTFFRDIEVPSKISLGAYYQATNNLLVIVEYNIFAAPEDSVLIGTGISSSGLNPLAISHEEVSQKVAHIGAEYVLTSSKKLDIVFRGGGYIEPSKADSTLSRKHITYGIEARMGPVVIGVSFDQADNFQNSSQALSFSFGAI